jgi:hypothetical protein
VDTHMFTIRRENLENEGRACHVCSLHR